MSRKHLWAGIYALYELLVENCNEEARYQSLFESHPAIFEALGYDQALPFEKSSEFKLPYDNDRGFTPEPDFICSTDKSRLVTVFELKTPFAGGFIVSRTDGNRKKLKAALEGYISQTGEYIGSISDREEARNYLKDIFNLEKISIVSGTLVFGMHSEDYSDAMKLISQRVPRIEIIPFDTLLDNIIDIYGSGRPDAVKRSGIMHILHINICSKQLCERAYILDMGTQNKDRFSIYIEDGGFWASFFDSNGRQHLADCKIEFDQPSCIRVQCSNENNRKFISIFVDNEEVYMVSSNKEVPINIEFANMILGADLDQQHGSCFLLHEMIAVGKTIGYKDQLGSYHYYKNKISLQSPGLLFDGSKFMYRDPHTGSLLQPKPEFAPQYSTGT